MRGFGKVVKGGTKNKGWENERFERKEWKIKIRFVGLKKREGWGN